MEVYACGPAIVKDFIKKSGKKNLIAQGIHPDRIGVKDIHDLAQLGNSLAEEVIREGAQYLGIGIASLINVLNPDIVVIGGGVAQIGESYLSIVRSAVKERAVQTVKNTPIMPAALGAAAGKIGAACLAWKKMGFDLS